MKHEKVSGRQRKPEAGKHILKQGLGLTKKIIAHYGRRPSPREMGDQGGRKERERGGERKEAR